MPVYGSSIPSNLVFSGVGFVTGSTGATGPVGATGLSLTGPTGSTGPQFRSADIQGGTFNLYYEGLTFAFSVTGPSGSLQRRTDVTFEIREKGSADAHSIYIGPDESDLYKFNFKTIRVVGEGSGGISGDAFYIKSPATTNGFIGATGSLFYINTGTGGFGLKIDGTNDENTNYYRSIITPNGSSKLGITLDTFSFKINQNYDTEFKPGVLNANINWVSGTISDFSTFLNYIDIDYSLLTSTSDLFLRTDQSVFSTFRNNVSNSITPKIVFRAEGITLNSSATQYNPQQVSFTGTTIVYGKETYADSVLGSCCYCSVDQTGSSSILHKSCIDYASKDFCESIRGNFSFKSCSDRYLDNDCYSGGACCVNGVCLETNSELCNKVFGTFYPNVRCGDLEEGCPTGCILEASCCIDGTCYSLPATDSSIDLCDELGGSYNAGVTCGSRNCCVEGFRGACCVGKDDCYDDSTPIECKNIGGVYQGPGTICASTTCCKDQEKSSTLKSMAFTANAIDVPTTLKVGDSFGGGIVAGFVGYPPPPGLAGDDSYFARGEVISEIENNILNSVKRYVAVNGVYNPVTKCNCSNFAPSRYVDMTKLARSNGNPLFADVKSISGVKENYNLTFSNRLSDVCLYNDGRPCNDSGSKLYGYNSILAYKQLCKQIHGDDVPTAWVLIVSPEDFGGDSLSFGMSLSVNGFNTPAGLENYGNSLWQNNVMTPYGTTVFDGLLNTRMMDETSIERNNWYIPSTYTIDGKIETLDPLAYSRFRHSRNNYWQSEIDIEKMSRNSGYFKEKYREMWTAINTSDTALYQVSQKNKESYNGYSDWYIPSALELNIINYNLDQINLGIINNTSGDWTTISNLPYWSSTTGSKLVTINPYNTAIKTYESHNLSLEGNITTGNSLIDVWRNYKTAQAHRAYTQDMSNGRMVSAQKSTLSARLRACRMVPIYFRDKDLKDQYEFSFKTLNTCASCR